jgi:hypothetical protein
MSPPQIVVGSRVVLFVNGSQVGRVTSFQFSSSTMYKPIYTLDCSIPPEFVPGQIKTIGSVSVYRTAGDGGAEGLGMTTDYPSINRQKYFTLALVLRDTGVPIFEANHCVLQNQSWSAGTKGFVTGVLNFEARSYEDDEVADPPA